MPKLTIAMSMTATLRAPRKISSRGHACPSFAAKALILALLSGATIASLPHRARAQQVGFAPLVTLGSEAEERLRLSQLLGQSSGAGFLIRSASRLAALAPAPTDTSGWRADLLAPETRVIRNSGIPFSLNQGPLWAGRGWNEEITAGLELRKGPVRLVVAPTFVSEDNEIFQVIPYPQNAVPARSVWANPFHPLPESIDLPLRFGDRRIEHLDPGQTSITVDAGAFSVGAGTENLWWGPGIQNAITLSNNAPGFPHLVVESRRPWQTRAGTFDAQWMLGQLSSSEFFLTDSANLKRALNGVALAWTTPFDSALTIGLARLVMARQSGTTFPIGAGLDVLRTVGHPDTGPEPASTKGGGLDQITSLFARWLLAPAGFEAYVEWARFEEPASLQDFLEYPGHSEGYTIGLQWAHRLSGLRGGPLFRLASEASYLEPDPSLRLRPVATTYTSRVIPEGFTQLGRTLGAAIGPGSSSQWLAAEVFARAWRLGPYLERIRWDNGTLFEPIVPEFKQQDVTLLAGLRGSVSWRSVNLLIDFAHATRFNYLYQSYVLGPSTTGGIDLVNNTFAVTLSVVPDLLRSR